ncbi:MAG: hypothetical protein LQ337_005505 [Flavoplaca oasis]|nr:MAG: hypothetical protein LQ337_005505 [Flavoplaca oasis]
MTDFISRDVLLFRSAPNVPALENFLRRSYHSSTAVGDFVYIDGGEVLQLPTNNDNGDPTGKLVNVTLSIDMRTSWTNDTVSIRSIDKGAAPNLNKQILWPSTDNQTFFAFGGEQGHYDGLGPDPPDVSCWQFTADGDGGGLWDMFSPADDSVFHQLTRPDSASGATVGNTGFILKGVASARTSPETLYYSGRVPIPGIVSFNITSNLWQNDTMPQYIENLSAPEGLLASVDAFGTDGLLVTTGLALDADNPPSFNNITIYDPSDKSWHAQTATGQIPAARSLACTVSAKGDNGTYELFLYGGTGKIGINGNISLTQYIDFTALDEVYVLSLPAFAWFKADYPAQHPRIRHTCHSFGRQMLSIGGQDPTNEYNDTFTPDPFSQGLGIFDLTNLRWSDRYNADAEPYETPAVVKAWYAANGPSTRTWDSPVVQRLFSRNIGSSGAVGTASSSTSSEEPNSSTTGAIVGGVVGGTAALCLVAGLAWWLRRRKRRTTHGHHENPSQEQTQHQIHKDHLQSDVSAQEEPFDHEMPDDYRPYEMDGTHATAEMATAHSAAELYGGSPNAEMDASTQSSPRAR